jgi:tyrosyl-tRNA synthetase
MTGSMKLLAELQDRNLVHDVTGADALQAALEAGPLTFYCGYDPTAISLHAGNLVPLSVMTRLARAGHKMIAVVGGATGMVGDPSGKAEERKLLDPATLEQNIAALRSQIGRFVSADAVVVNNADWIGRMSYLEFLRDVGKLITVNYMLAKESVRARLEDREQGISYTEFSYMLLQGYDFAHLARTYDCRLQVGGSDQWGNITCGIELSRKLGHAKELFGLVTPLLLTSAGKKFGKSEEGSVWLDGKLTSPYKFYQYWINTADEDVERYLKMFTFVPLDEIAAAMKEHERDRAQRVAQKRLAEEVTTWVHGAETTRQAQAATAAMFSGGAMADADLDAMPQTTWPRAELEAGVALVDTLVRVKLAKSKSEARRLIEQGGIYVNNLRVDDVARVLSASDLGDGKLILRAGKKSYHLIRAG